MMRKKKFALNTISALIQQLVLVSCGFILPRYILSNYGSSINGLLTSITQFLGFISFLEFGIGPVIQSNLYKPLADKDDEMISRIVSSSEKFFKKIAMIFIAYIVVLIFLFPFLAESKYSFWYTASLVIIMSVSMFAQYYFGITYQLLLNADQKSYVQLNLQSIMLILNTILSIVIMNFGGSIHVVKLVSAIIYLLRPIGQSVYVHKHYNIDKHIIYKGEPIKQKWNGFAQHLASVVVANTDVTLLTIFSTLQNVSIYSVYYNVVHGITNMVMTMVTGLESLWGNMIANGEHKKLKDTFESVEWMLHMGCTLLFTVCGIMIVPFVKVYTYGINDADYIVPLFAVLLVIAYAAMCLRVPYFRIIKAAGHYKETQNGSFIQMFINVILSVVLIFKYGLNGVAAGTLIAMFYHTTYFAWYLRKNILNRNFRYYIKHICVDILTSLLCVILTKNITLREISYISWVIMALKVTMISILVSVIINLIIYHKIFQNTIRFFRKK